VVLAAAVLKVQLAVVHRLLDRVTLAEQEMHQVFLAAAAVLAQQAVMQYQMY
jgi:hypothetical protein